ncbi:peroxiredoxin family protein [Chungangia koreensis]|uniref:Peroxiredoxin family protein n=1 Tax=Chungangia koreensis TaxID=752657 RepID=A0ABV8X327_9LACT
MKKKVFGLLIVAILVAIMVTQYVRGSIEESQKVPEEAIGTSVDILPESGLEKGKAPPDFEVKTLDGESVKLSDYKGKKVILNFWASWCPPCKAEMPHMQNYYEDYAEKDNVEILAVNLTNAEYGGIDDAIQFVEDYELTFPIPTDEDGSLEKTYEILTIPTTFTIDTAGLIRHKIVGPMDEQMMIDLVDSME